MANAWVEPPDHCPRVRGSRCCCAALRSTLASVCCVAAPDGGVAAMKTRCSTSPLPSWRAGELRAVAYSNTMTVRAAVARRIASKASFTPSSGTRAEIISSRWSFPLR